MEKIILSFILSFTIFMSSLAGAMDRDEKPIAIPLKNYQISNYATQLKCTCSTETKRTFYVKLSEAKYPYQVKTKEKN